MLVTEQSPAVRNPTAVKHGANRAMRPGRVIGCPVNETTLLIVGLGRVLAGEVVAGEVIVGVDGDQTGTRSAFVSEWRLAAPSPRAKHGFAALLPTEGTDRAMTAIRFGEEETSVRYIFAPRLASAEEAAAIVAETAGPQSAAVIDRLVDVMMAGNLNRRGLLTVTALLQAAHANDGFIELIGESHEGATFLQGWSRGMAPGPCRVSVVGNATPVASECGIAVFSRPDAPDGAPGLLVFSRQPRMSARATSKVWSFGGAPAGGMPQSTPESASSARWKRPNTSGQSCRAHMVRQTCSYPCERPLTALMAKKPSPACRFPSGWE